MDFRFKTHMLHESWKYYLPKSFKKKLTPENSVSFFFWEGSFQFKETIILSYPLIAKDLENFVRAQHAYPASYYRLDTLRLRLKSLARTLLGRSRPLRLLAERFLGKKIAAAGPEADRGESFWNSIPEIHLR